LPLRERGPGEQLMRLGALVTGRVWRACRSMRQDDPALSTAGRAQLSCLQTHAQKLPRKSGCNRCVSLLVYIHTYMHAYIACACCLCLQGCCCCSGQAETPSLPMVPGTAEADVCLCLCVCPFVRPSVCPSVGACVRAAGSKS